MKKLVSLILVVGLLTACATSSFKPDITAYDEWDMVFLSASNGWLVADKYADHIEEEMGVNVNVYDLSIGSLATQEVLDLFEGRGRAYQRLELEYPDVEDPLQLFRDAEVVVVSVFDPRLTLPSDVLNQWSCYETPPNNYVNDCSIEDWQPYYDDYRTIVERIFELRGDQPIIVRGFDLPARPDWWLEDDPGDFEDCSACWSLLLEMHEAILADYNVPFAPVHQIWSAPNGRGNPADKGYIGSDGLHSSETGAQSMADMLHELGYEVTQPDSAR